MTTSFAPPPLAPVPLERGAPAVRFRWRLFVLAVLFLGLLLPRINSGYALAKRRTAHGQPRSRDDFAPRSPDDHAQFCGQLKETPAALLVVQRHAGPAAVHPGTRGAFALAALRSGLPAGPGLAGAMLLPRRRRTNQSLRRPRTGRLRLLLFTFRDWPCSTPERLFI